MTEETPQALENTEQSSEHAPALQDALTESHEEEAPKDAEEQPAPEPVKEEDKSVEAPVPDEEKPTEEPSKEEEAPESVEEAAPAPASVPETPPVVEPEVTVPAEEPVVQATTVDNSLVAQLNKKLEDFRRANSLLGDKPENFEKSASLTLSLTNFVIKYPKVEVLDALLDFFKDNIDGVCSHEEFMKGSTTLNKFDEQRVGFLFNLFSELAKGLVIPVNAGLLTTVFKGPQIPAYFNRKVAFLRQQNGKK